jgi:hypothetical protein
MPTHNMPVVVCTSCGKSMDAASNADEAPTPPHPGDISICLYCGHLMVFDSDLCLRALTDAEIVEVAGDPRLVRATNLLKKLKR